MGDRWNHYRWQLGCSYGFVFNNTSKKELNVGNFYTRAWRGEYQYDIDKLEKVLERKYNIWLDCLIKTVMHKVSKDICKNDKHSCLLHTRDRTQIHLTSSISALFWHSLQLQFSFKCTLHMCVTHAIGDWLNLFRSTTIMWNAKHLIYVHAHRAHSETQLIIRLPLHRRKWLSSISTQLLLSIIPWVFFA